MNERVKSGKRRTILISVAILLVSIHTIYFYHAVRPEIETKKIVQQLIRFLFTVGLLIAIYQGKKWAKVISIILFSMAILVSLAEIITIKSESLVAKIPLLVMVLVYSIAVYHFGVSKNFKVFFDYQNGKKIEYEATEENQG